MGFLDFENTTIDFSERDFAIISLTDGYGDNVVEIVLESDEQHKFKF